MSETCWVGSLTFDAALLAFLGLPAPLLPPVEMSTATTMPAITARASIPPNASCRRLRRAALRASGLLALQPLPAAALLFLLPARHGRRG